VFLTAIFLGLCSCEHESDSPVKALAAPHSFTAKQATQAPPATGTESMAETSLKPLKAILEAIREQAEHGLKQLQDAEEKRSMRWKCKDCDYMKHFTRPVSIEAAGKCPRCRGASFEPC